MKLYTYLYLALALFFTVSINAQVGIGTTSPNAALDVTSTTDGFLIPRVALTDLTTLTVLTPTASEIVYNTTSNGTVEPGFYYLSSATGPWIRFGGSGWLTDGNNDITAASFMGTVSGHDFDVAFRRNGLAAGRLSTTNTSFGLGSLNTGGSNNAAFGLNALNVNTGINNVAIGSGALSVNTGGNQNVAVGYHALVANTQSLRNTAVGYESMATLNSSGAVDNVAVGWQAMRDAPSGVTNSTFVGVQAGRRNTGSNSTGIGKQALGSNNGGPSSGIDNTAVGHQALTFNTSGQQNTGIGAESLYRVTTGRENTAIGFRSGGALTQGIQNTLLGYQAGSGLTTGNNNLAIGYQAQVPSATADNQVRIGNAIVSVAEIQVAWTITSDKRYKSEIQDSPLGLDFINSIRPVSYYRKNDKNNKTEFGFIAQELEEALSKANLTNNGIILKDDAGMYGVRYNDLISITVKAVQEQQDIIEELQKQNAELKEMNAAILKRLEALEQKN